MNRLRWLTHAGWLSLSVAAVAWAQQRPLPLEKVEVEVRQLAPDVYFLLTPGEPNFIGSNSGWVIFNDYVVVIDAGFPFSARHVIDAVRKTTKKPIRFVFDTHYHGDHSFGNGVYVSIGAVGIGHTLCIRDQRQKNPIGWLLQHRSPSARQRALVEGTELKHATVAFERKLVLDDGRQRVELLHFGHGHTPGDAVAYLPKQKIVFTGDLCVNGPYNYMGDADTESWIRVLEHVQQLDIDTVAPGHGPPAGKELLELQKRYIQELRRHVITGVLEGKSFAEIRDSLQLPFYKSWTGVEAKTREENLLHVYAEILGLVPRYYLLRDLGLKEGPSPTKHDPGWTKPKKVLVPRFSPLRMAALQVVAGDVQLVPYRNAREAVRLVADADAVIGVCTPELVRAGKKLRWIQVPSAGVERYVTIPELAERGIVLTNAQRIYGPEIADHAFAMLLAFTRGIRSIVAHRTKGGRWNLPPDFKRERVIELTGKTVLVVGLGGIGTEVARRAAAFGCRVLAIDPKPLPKPDFVFRLGKPNELLELAAQADVVFNCAPLTRVTEGWFNDEFFGAMKPTAYFISVGRGRSTDTDALVRALRAGQIAGAGLDVTDPEPLPPDHPLWRFNNVIITPHMASWSDRRNERLFELYRENLRRFVNGDPLLNVVDLERGY